MSRSADEGRETGWAHSETGGKISAVRGKSQGAQLKRDSTAKTAISESFEAGVGNVKADNCSSSMEAKQIRPVTVATDPEIT